MVMSRSALVEAWAPEVELEPSDGKARLSFQTETGPMNLLLAADVVLLLQARLSEQLNRRPPART